MANDKGTIKIPREDFDRHNKQRKEKGLTWLEYINGQAPEYPDLEQVMNQLSMANEPGVEDMIQTQEEIIENQSEALEHAKNTVEEVQQQRDILIQVLEAIDNGEVESCEVVPEIKKAQEIAESARDNTEQIKEGMRG